MATKRANKRIDLSDIEGLLKKAKAIRAKYKALKSVCDIVKDGDAVEAQEMRRLADALQKAIDDAHSGV